MGLGGGKHDRDQNSGKGINTVVVEDGMSICTIDAEPAPHGGVGVGVCETVSESG
jgi:hypothetical protein